MLLSRVITALITPFYEDRIDLEGFAKNIEFQLKHSVAALLVGGTTGESMTLDLSEFESLISVAAKTIRRRVPLMVGIGESATKRSLIKMEIATKLGADVLLVVTPAYNRPSQEGLYIHFKAIAKASKLPLILYNNPSRTGVALEIETLKRLSHIKGIIGIKESSGNMEFAQEMLYQLPREFLFLCGDDALALPLMVLGARGVISTLANLMPAQVVSFVEATLENDLVLAQKWYKKLYPYFRACRFESNPMPIKKLMQLKGLSSGNCRLPLTQLSSKHEKTLKALLESSTQRACHE